MRVRARARAGPNRVRLARSREFRTAADRAGNRRGGGDYRQLNSPAARRASRSRADSERRMMFGRLLWSLLRGNRGRLTVALVAVISGATVISALLNVELDIGRKLAQEFRELGP